MSTQNNTRPEELLLATDPEAIIQSSNTERRNSTQHRPLAPPPAIHSRSPEMQDNSQPAVGPTQAPASSATPPEVPDVNGSYRNWFHAVLKVQHEGALQAQDDCQLAREQHRAASDRLAQLEEAMITLALKTKPTGQHTPPIPNRVDLQKFCTSNGPIFHGPFQEAKPFLRWINGVQIFFETKGVVNSSDKIKIIGSLISETNILAFYATKAKNFVSKTRKDFCARLFKFALPPLWQTKLKKQIRHLQMRDDETFMGYSTHARTIQHMLNFVRVSVDDFELAEYLTCGLSASLEARVNDHQLLCALPFIYSEFESRVSGFYTGLHKFQSTKAVASTPSPAPPGHISKEDFIWRIHSYLDSRGICHFCKENCGNAAGACPGPIDRSLVDIPPLFKTPPKPTN